MTTHILHNHKNQLKDFWMRQMMLEGAFLGFLSYNAILIGSFLLTRFLPADPLVNDLLSLASVLFTWGVMAGFVLMPCGALAGAVCGFLYAYLLEALSHRENNPLINAGAYQKFATVILATVLTILFLIGLIILSQADGSRFGLTVRTVGYTSLLMLPAMLLVLWRLQSLHQHFAGWYFGADGRKRKAHDL